MFIVQCVSSTKDTQADGTLNISDNDYYHYKRGTCYGPEADLVHMQYAIHG